MPSIRHRQYSITLTEFEKIVPYGVSRQTWSVYHERRWIAARLVPGAIVILLQSKRGTIWERSVELKLIAASQLELMSERPRPRKQVDAFSILTSEQASPVLVRKTPYQLTTGGQLIRSTR